MRSVEAILKGFDLPGWHLESTTIALSRERVRRAQIGLAMLARSLPDAIASPLPRVPVSA
jgi:hypothetical protein